MSFKREFLEDHIPFGLGYSARETFYNQLEKTLLEAIEKDGFVTVDDHNAAIAKAVDQAYNEGYMAGNGDSLT